MKNQLTILFIFIVACSYSQSSELTTNQEQAIQEKYSMLYGKALEFKKQGLFTEVYDRQSHWSCTPDKKPPYIKAKLKELSDIKTKWKRPNGDIARYKSYVKDFNDYVQKTCRDHNMFCNKTMREMAVENSMAYLERYIAKFKECLRTAEASSVNSNPSSRSSNYSSNNYSNKNQNNNYDYRQKTQTEIDRVHKSSEQFSNSIKALFTKTKRDRSGEPLIKDRSYENKAIVAKWKRKHDAYEKALKGEKERRVEKFVAFFKDTTNRPAIQKAVRSFDLGPCPNPSCHNGKVEEKELKICGGCGGKGYMQFGVFVAQGQTRHPNDGKKICKSCNGSGLREYKTEEKCEVCLGYPDQAFIYKGDYSLSTENIENVRTYLRKDVYSWIKVKQYFKENPDKEYYYKFQDNGKTYTGITYINRKLEYYLPENHEEITKQLFEDLKEKRQKQKVAFEKYTSIQPVEKIKGSEDLWIAELHAKRTHIVDGDGNEILNLAVPVYEKEKIHIDSAFYVPSLKRIVTYHTNSKNKIYCQLFSREGEKIRNQRYTKRYDFGKIYHFHLKKSNKDILVNDQYGYHFIRPSGAQVNLFPETRKITDFVLNFTKYDDLGLLKIRIQSEKKQRTDHGYYEHRYGFVDLDYNTVIPAEFQNFGSITKEGIEADLIPAQKKGNWGFVDHKGNTVIKFKYQPRGNLKSLANFKNGKTWVKRRGKVFQIDTEGNELD